MKPYSEDLRTRVVAARQAGQSAEEVASVFQISRRTVQRYCKLQAATGQLAARQMGGYRRSRLAPHDATLLAWVKARNDLTLVQIQGRCGRELGVKISLAALWHRLRQLGLTFKKNTARHRTRPSRRANRQSLLAGGKAHLGATTAGVLG